MNIFHDIKVILLAHLESLYGDQISFERVVVEPPRDPAHGDIATNAAMVLAKPLQKQPREVAEDIVRSLQADAVIETVEIAGAGFINMRLADNAWHDIVADIIESRADYGRAKIGQEAALNVEYVSANPTGPMHVGHARGAVVGDVLANLLAFAGYNVTREYYINDAGSQVDILAQSVLLRAREAAGEIITIADGLYPGDYLIPVGQKLYQDYDADLFSKPMDEQLKCATDYALPAMMDMIKDDLAALGVRHDVFVSEKNLHENGMVENALAKLEAQGLVYQGVLEPPKGKELSPDWHAQEQTLFRSSQFGDDSDRALKKADGSWTYFAPDIAYHLDKAQRGFAHMVNVWGADHAGYVKRMAAAVAALTNNTVQFDVKTCQMVKLMRGGEQVKMSKRAGNFVTLREVVDEVGADAVRFIMLTRKNDAPLDFDFDLVKEQSRDNPVFYVNYAHARICSVLRQAPDISGVPDISLLGHESEIALIKQMANFPRTIESAAKTHEPHRLCFYMQELAASFHSLWNMGKTHPELKFIQENKDLTIARLALLNACQIVFQNAAAIIGIHLQEEMR